MNQRGSSQDDEWFRGVGDGLHMHNGKTRIRAGASRRWRVNRNRGGKLVDWYRHSLLININHLGVNSYVVERIS